MSLTEDDLLGKLIDWHNETDTVVRVDINDPFIKEILQNQKLRELIEKFLEIYHYCNPYKGKEDPLFFQDIQKILEESKK